MATNSDAFRTYLFDHLPAPEMVYDFKTDFFIYQQALKEKLTELLCLDKIKENACKVTYKIEKEEIIDNYTKIRFTVETETNCFIPCLLAYPNSDKKKYKLAITLQGHSNGMYQSFGEIREPGDEKLTWKDYARQAVNAGYAALCIELRGIGELQSSLGHWDNGGKCKYLANTAMLLGRTLIGERVWDVMRVLDIMPDFPFVDTNHILITGCSGGGTLSFYAGALDDRIEMSAPDCGFSTYRESICDHYHCICNYIPHAYEYFDMTDLTALYVGKKLLLIGGVKDTIFPISGVRLGYQKAKKFFALEGRENDVHLLETPLDHHWCGELIWPEIQKYF